MKKRTHTKYIVVHCAATSPSQDIGYKDIDRWHRARGWLSGGYHIVIRRDGIGEPGRPMDVPGAHVEGHNHHSIGICLAGGIAEDANGKPLPDVPEDNFTPAQLDTLGRILQGAKRLYPEAQIVGHGDLDPRKPHCPGFDLKAFLAARPEITEA